MELEPELPGDFADELRVAFAFLEAAGFELASAKELRGYTRGLLVTFKSPRVIFEVELDHRGSVDAVVSLLADPFRQVHVANFATLPAPEAGADPVPSPGPPFRFDGRGGRDAAVELLAAFTSAHAMRALQGEMAVFRDASRRP